MIWNDERLLFGCAHHALVSPLGEGCINPASIDLRLGNQICVPNPLWAEMSQHQMQVLIDNGNIRNLPHWSDPIEFSSYWLMPQGKGVSFVLCASLEFVHIPDDSIALLFSKSSVGRIGLEHLHAGYGDCGFQGTWTWELHNVAPWPIELVAGKRIMQQVMVCMTDKPLRTYQQTGRYNGQVAPQPAREERHE